MNLKSIFSKKDSLEISQDQKQQILLTVFIIIILITIILLYFGFWRSSMFPTNTEEQFSDRNVSIEKVIEKIDFDINFLKASSFQDLKTYSQWPLEIGEKGRQNPFLPY